MATNCPLNDLTINVHRLQAACLNVLKFTFQLPQATIDIDDDDDDNGVGGSGGGASSQGQDSAMVVVDLEAEASSCPSGPSSSGANRLAVLALQDEPLFRRRPLQSRSSSSLLPQDSQDQEPASQSQPSCSMSQLGQSQQQPQSQSQWSWSQQSQSQPPSSVEGRRPGARRVGRFARQRQLQAQNPTEPEDPLSDPQVLLQKEPHELVKLLLNEKKKTAKLQDTKKAYLKQVQTLRRKCASLVKSQEKQKQLAKPNSQFAIAKRGKQAEGRGGRFTLSSWFSIGIRKCLSQVAACDFGLTTMTDISGQTVMRCEKKTCAALVHTFRLFMAEALGYAASCRQPSGASEAEVEVVLHGLPADQQAVEPKQVCCKIAPVVSTELLRASTGGACDDGDGRWSLLSVGIMNDATNSNIWRRKKLNVCEVKVQWVSNFDALLEGNFAGAVSTRRSTWLGFIICCHVASLSVVCVCHCRKVGLAWVD